MTRIWKTRLVMLALLAIGAMVFILGITWGLPSRAADPFLFGERAAWSGQEIVELAGGWSRDESRGADVDANPLADRTLTVCLNETDAERAEIIRRYRLYSYHPDEMVTFRALASMHPGQRDLDPKLYQYGGLWVYPVGALLKLASLGGVITLTNDPTYYLDHPEAFARFYVLARLYVVGWALLGVWVVFWLARRWAGDCINAGTAAALFYTFMPAVVTMSHEAKPHLPGTVLMLLAVAAALRYVETGRRRWWLTTACGCGAAVGMVLNCWPIFAVLPVMLGLRKRTRLLAETMLGGLVGIGVYFLTNPYVLVNLLANRDLLRSNLANTRAMFEIGPWWMALPNALLLIGQGTSVILAVVGVSGAAALLVRGYVGKRSTGSSGTRGYDEHALPTGSGWLLAAPALLLFAQFAVCAAGQAGEYARFALFCDVALAIAAAVVVKRYVASRVRRWVGVGFMLITVALPGSGQLSGFIRDSGPDSTRMAVARQLQRLTLAGARSIGILAEPAPYSVPPVDLFATRLLLLPRNYRSDGGRLSADAIVGTPGAVTQRIDTLNPSYRILETHRRSAISTLEGEVGMSWADKGFIVVVDYDYMTPTTQRTDHDHAY